MRSDRYDAPVLVLAVIIFFMFAAPVAYLASLIWLSALPRVKPKDRCGACGYNRAGLVDLAVCPECGNKHGLQIHESFRLQAASAALGTRLTVIPLAMGLAASLIAVPAAYLHGGLIAAVVLPVLGVCSVLPGALLGFIVPGRLSQAMAWTMCLSTSLPSVAFIGFVGVMTLLESDYELVIVAIMAPILGGLVSLMASAITGCITAAVYQRRLRDLRSAAPRGDQAESGPLA